MAGRFDNPFWSPTDLVWYRELGFDGVAIQAKHDVTQNFTPFWPAGAFPIYNTDFNAGINASRPEPRPADTKLRATTSGCSADRLAFAPGSGRIPLRMAVAYYDFDNVQGQCLQPCSVFTKSRMSATPISYARRSRKRATPTGRCATSSPSLQQLRQAINQFQYFGLASAFRPVVASAQLDLGSFHPDPYRSRRRVCLEHGVRSQLHQPSPSTTSDRRSADSALTTAATWAGSPASRSETRRSGILGLERVCRVQVSAIGCDH